MGLYLNGRGSYLVNYVDEDGSPKSVRVKPRQNVEDMGLPAGTLKNLKEAKSGRNNVFVELNDAPPRHVGHAHGSISMDNFKKAPEKVADKYVADADEYGEDAEDAAALGPHVVVKPAPKSTEARASEEEVMVRPAYAPKSEDNEPDEEGRATPRPGEWEPDGPRDSDERPKGNGTADAPRQQEWADPSDRDGYHNMPEPDGLKDKAKEVKEAAKEAAKEAKEAVKDAAKDAKKADKDEKKSDKK